MWPTPFCPKWIRALLGAGALVFIAGMMPVRADETPIDEVGGDPAVTTDPTVEVSPHDQDVNMGTIQTGSFYGHIPWYAHANRQEVRLWAAVSPLYKDDDPTNPAVPPIMPSENYGVLIEASYGVWVDANVHAYVDTTTIDGFPCLVTEAIGYASGDGGTWSYPCMTTVKWDQPDPEKPPGEYSGRVRFYASYVGLSHAAQELLGFGAYRADHDFGTARCVVTVSPLLGEGTCCHVDGTCIYTVQEDCQAPAVWHGGGTTCDPNPCPPGGACCEPTGLCTLVTTGNCPETSIWQGAGVPCNPNPCLSGACCLGSEGICRIYPPTECALFSGWYFGNGALCAPSDTCLTTGVNTTSPAVTRLQVLTAPNPSAAGVVIRCLLPLRAPTTVVLFDASGRMVRRLHDGDLPAGETPFSWDGLDDTGRGVPAGVYLVKVSTPAGEASGRMVLSR